MSDVRITEAPERGYGGGTGSQRVAPAASPACAQNDKSAVCCGRTYRSRCRCACGRLEVRRQTRRGRRGGSSQGGDVAAAAAAAAARESGGGVDDHFGRPRLRPCVSLSVCLSNPNPDSNPNQVGLLARPVRRHPRRRGGGGRTLRRQVGVITSGRTLRRQVETSTWRVLHGHVVILGLHLALDRSDLRGVASLKRTLAGAPSGRGGTVSKGSLLGHVGRRAVVKFPLPWSCELCVTDPSPSSVF